MGIIGIFRSLLRGEVSSGADRKGSEDGGKTYRTGAMDVLVLGGPAMRISTVLRCVKLLSDSVAVLPMQYLRRKGDIFVPDTSSRLHYLLNVQPHPGVSAFDFWRQTVIEILLEGNAYIVPVYNPASMDIDRIVLCARGTVQHDTTNDIYTVSDADNGVYGEFDESEIIHLKGIPSESNSKRGISVITHARLTINIAETGAKETLNRCANGGNVRGFLHGSASGVRGLGSDQDEQLEKLAAKTHAGFSNGDPIQTLPKHIEFQPVSLSSTDMQFLETCKFNVREICRFFGVHPSFVFDDTSNNYKSAEMANVAFLSTTLNPLLKNIESEFQRKLIPEWRNGKNKFQFDRRSIYACDMEGRMKYLTQILGIGGATVNELRRLENMSPVPGGDTVLVSANLRNIKELNNQSIDEGKQ